MKTWIWPLSWYFRIRELKATIAVLQVKNRELDGMMRAQAVAHTSMTAAYVASATAIAGMATRR